MESPKIGLIKLYTGCMKSGKTEELLNRLNRAHYEKIPYIAFRPHIPNLDRAIKARNLRFKVNAKYIDPRQPENMLRFTSGARIVAIDEAQFFKKSLNNVVQDLYLAGKKIYLTALDTTYDGEPWPIVADLKSLPEVQINNQYAVCEVCSQRATRTFKKPTAPGEKVLIGDGEFYEARCLYCWLQGEKEKKI